MKKIFIILASVILVIIAIFTMLLSSPNPEVIADGENKYTIGKYDLTQQGLDGFKEFINKSSGMMQNYTVDYFEANIDKNGRVKTFTLSLSTFDENNQYCGTAGYTYADRKLYYNPPIEITDKLVYERNQNSDIDYLDGEIKKIPLKKQIAISGMDNYVIRYQPYTMVESGTPIFDGRDGSAFEVLNNDDYNEGKGGKSDGKTNVVFRLYNGQSIAMGQQYLYVCKPIDAQTAVGDRLSTMECDYYINNGALKFTRNYGADWIDTDITEDEINSTMQFYRNSLALPKESIFISSDESIPIAYFYGENPILKITHDNGNNWSNSIFPNSEAFGRPITKRAVGFVSSNFGYSALGTDWSMGAGENKMCYFTFDGGENWIEKPLPLQGQSSTFRDMSMANEEVGVVVLDDTNDENFPLLFITSDMGDTWVEIKLPFDSLPQEVQYIIDVESFKYSDGLYTLTLGQGDYGTVRADFTTQVLDGNWKFTEFRNSTIHTVG